MSSHHQLNALYCDERHWDDDSNEDVLDNTLYPNDNVLEDKDLTSLLHKELENEPQRTPSRNPQARGEAVDWMLNVVDFYSFSPLTAVLAVNYFDRFLHSFESEGKPWMTQLAAVACLSLAAKIEETHVPLLLDLQVEETKYVFESKTIQRMEVLVLSTLQWRMHPVTPLSFLDYIARTMNMSRECVRSCHSLLLSLLSECRFMSYLPSELATAIMVCVISSLDPTIGVGNQEQLIGILGIKKDEVEKCCRLIQEVATRAAFYNKRKLPGSPKGVVDVSFSSDASYDSSAAASVSSSPEPLFKKLKPK